jgi:hypothetical protein
MFGSSYRNGPLSDAPKVREKVLRRNRQGVSFYPMATIDPFMLQNCNMVNEGSLRELGRARRIWGQYEAPVRPHDLPRFQAAAGRGMPPCTGVL